VVGLNFIILSQRKENSHISGGLNKMIEQILIGAGIAYYIIHGIYTRKPKIERVMDDIWYANKLEMSRPKVGKANYGFHLIYRMLPNKDINDFLKLQDTIKANTGFGSEIWAEYGWLHIRLIGKPLEQFKFDPKVHTGIPIGQGYDSFYQLDLRKISHLLIGGKTRFGKTSLIRLMVTCALTNKEIEDVYMIDLKMVDLTIFEKWARVETDEIKATKMLKELHELMNNRYQEFREMGIQKVEEHPKMKRIIIVIDESADLSLNKNAMELIDIFSRKGAGAGIHLWLATQHPSAVNKVMPTKIKQNMLGRIGFKCGDAISSRMIVNDASAYKLPAIPGRAIYYDGVYHHEIQVPYLDAKLVPELLNGKVIKKTFKGTQKEDSCIDACVDAGFTIG